MESGSRGYGPGCEMMALLENANNSSIWVPSSSSSSFHETMVNFDLERCQGRRATPKRAHSSDGDEEEYEMNPYHQAEKKRRLTAQQVEYLEKSFEMENRLEPERKVQLAKELGLQPRQVAIWFQNRRARYKTKQLEKDYDSLKASYGQLQLDFDSLSRENQDLQNEIKALTKKLKQRDEAKDCNNPDSRYCQEDNLPKWENQMLGKTGLMAISSANKQLVEDANSAKSDVVDSQSPQHFADGNHFEDPADQQSDFSQGEEERLRLSGKALLPAPPPPPSLLSYSNLIKVEEDGCYDDLNASSCSFSLVDDHPFLNWLC